MISADTIVFTSAVLILAAVEITLIISVLKLNSNIKALNQKTQEYFGSITSKIKGLVDLFIAVQTVKLNKEKESVEHGK